MAINIGMNRIPMPTLADGLTAAELAQHARDLEILERDPRTAGSANRPTRLVRRVLNDHRKER